MGGPIIVPFHQARATRNQARGKRAVGQKTRHRCGKVFGVTGDEQVLAVARPRRPSQPSGVETTGRPSAMASRILRRVPPPARKGTTATWRVLVVGKRKGTRPTKSMSSRPRNSPQHAGRPVAHHGQARFRDARTQGRQDVVREKTNASMLGGLAQVAHEDQALAGGGLGQRNAKPRYPRRWG